MTTFTTVPGPIGQTLPAPQCVGQVGAPAHQEATSSEFYLWVSPEAKIERTQLVTCQSTIAGKLYTFYGIVNEVYRSDRKRTMGGVIDEADSNIDRTFAQ